ncbi:MAG: translocation/assembly module TamB domain-containing protein [Pseudomonadales bacterium]
MKRLLVVGLGALLLTLFILSGVVVFLTLSEGGSRFLVAQAERFLPLTTEGVHGTLWRRLTAERVLYRLEHQEIEARGVVAGLDLWPLLMENRLQLDTVSARSLEIRVTGAPAEPGQPYVLQLPDLPITLVVDSLEVAQLTLPDLPALSVSLAGRWDGTGISVRTLRADSAEFGGTLSGSLSEGSRPRLEARFDWSAPQTGWSGSGTLRGAIDRLQLDHRLDGPYQVHAGGQVNLRQPSRPQVDLALEVADFALGAVAIDGLRGRLRGNLERFTLDTEAGLTTPWMPPLHVAANADGPPAGPVALQFSAGPLSGTLQGTGVLSWGQGLDLRLEGHASELNVAELRDGLSGRIGADLALRLAGSDLSLAVTALTGELNGRAVDGRLNLATTETGWRFDDVDLGIGSNRASGSVALAGNAMDVQARIQAPALDELALGVSGDLAGEIRASGVWPELDGSAALRSSLLSGMGFKGSSIDLKGSARNGRIDGTLRAAGLERDGMRVDGVTLAVDGGLPALNWRLDWTGGSGAGSLRREPDLLALRVDSLDLQLLDERWRLEAPLALQAAAGRVALQPFCMSAQQARACVQALNVADGQISTTGQLDALPVALFSPWLPIELGEGAYVEGRWQVAGAPGTWSGDLRLAARKLAYLQSSADSEPIELPDLELAAVLEGDGLRFTGNAVDPDFDVAAQGGLEPLTLDGSLSGTVTLRATDLAPLRVFDQRLAQVGGTASADLKLAGSPRAPRVAGQGRVSHGELKLQNPQFELGDIEIEVSLDDSGRLQLTGSAQQDNGSVALNGTGTDLFDARRKLSMSLTGEGLGAQHPDWEVVLSPDLRFDYADGAGHVSGALTVVKAEVRINALPPSAPKISDDVVVVGRDQNGAQASNRITVDVNLIFGDDVSLKTVGVTAGIEGELRARVDRRARTTLRGKLDITGGVVSSQGQVLQIESGSVVYNGPVDNPYIDVRAVRVIDDVTPSVKVGLQIRGNADNLTSSIFSEPPMSDTRALAFLVLGRDLDATSQEEGNQMITAAINLGLRSSSSIIGEVTRLTGLDELSAMAESQNSFAIVAGKRIGPDLYVRYTYNTLSAIGALLVRYDLTKRWRLEATSSETSSMDLLYSFEK